MVSEATWFQGCCCARRPARPPCTVHGTSDTACTWDIRNRRQRLITTYTELKKTQWRPRKRVSTAGEHGDHVTGGAQVHMSVRIIIMCCHTSNMSHCECVISRILITTLLLPLDKKKSCFISFKNIRILNLFPTWVSCRSPWQPGRWLNLFRDETFALGLYKDPHGSMFIHRARCHSLFVPAAFCVATMQIKRGDGGRCGAFAS